MSVLKEKEWNKLKKEYSVGDYICRRMTGESDFAYFFPVDYGFSTLLSKKFCELKGIDVTKTSTHWFTIDEFDTEKKHIKTKIITEYIPKNYAASYILSKYQENDIIKQVPIVSESDKYILIEIFPGFTAICFKNKIDFRKHSVGELVDVTVVSLSEMDGLLKIEVIIKERLNKHDTVLQNLENGLYNNPIITNKFIDLYYKLEINREDKLDEQYEIIRFAKETFREKIASGEYHFNHKNFEITFDCGIRDIYGSIICFGGKYDFKEDFYVLTFVGVSSSYAQSLIDYFADIEWDSALEELRNLALKGEKWEFSNTKRNFILEKYIRFTFYKASIDGLIYVNEKEDLAIFNTGLVDNIYNEIYCCFTKGRRDNKLRFSFFCTEYDNNGQMIAKRCGNLPNAVKYINNVYDVVYDVNLELTENLEHIIKQRLYRFPFEFIVDSCRPDKEFRAYYQNYEENKISDNELIDYIKNRDSLVRRIQKELNVAIENAKKRCKWNYKTAIPIYFIETNSISLMIPLCLGDIEKDKDDLALVVQKNVTEDGYTNYLGKTILTLDMAYLDARQICRPESEWLSPSDIFENEKEETIDEE